MTVFSPHVSPPCPFHPVCRTAPLKETVLPRRTGRNRAGPPCGPVGSASLPGLRSRPRENRLFPPTALEQGTRALVAHQVGTDIGVAGSRRPARQEFPVRTLSSPPFSPDPAFSSVWRMRAAVSPGGGQLPGVRIRPNMHREPCCLPACTREAGKAVMAAMTAILRIIGMVPLAGIPVHRRRAALVPELRRSRMRTSLLLASKRHRTRSRCLVGVVDIGSAAMNRCKGHVATLPWSQGILHEGSGRSRLSSEALSGVRDWRFGTE